MRFEYCIILYFVCINLLGALVNCADKRAAIKQRRRIPERKLWMIGLFGGAPLSYMTMRVIRHKTKHKSFMIGMPLLAILDVGICGYLLYIFMR